MKGNSDRREDARYCQVVKNLMNHWNRLVSREGILYIEVVDTDSGNIVRALVAPVAVRENIMRMAHETRASGHLGRDKTLSHLRRVVYWPGKRDDVARWCAGCIPCARKKPGPCRSREPLQHVNAGFPMQRIAIDILGPLPVTENGNEYVMVVTDYFTKWAEAFALPDHTALTVADKLLTNFVCRFGVPQTIHTDQGREFESILFSHLCEALEIEKTRTSLYRPQSDGFMERFNRTLQQMLAIFVNDKRTDWDGHLPLLLMACRSWKQQSTQCTSNLLMFGRKMMLPLGQ